MLNRKLFFYLDSFEAAMHKMRFHRRQMPAVYNDARVFEQPIPRAEYIAMKKTILMIKKS